ncbi:MULTISPECIES: hypothetical protein [unclassified Leifsonia]|uniref:hypothetical protein n=1 Tax=unclassified Leifsonia TaxID=2663824 RepID=UPI001442DFE9|nr:MULTISPECIES: hypothetical protein [unclassified Leifsonia]QIZ98385.1 hypothetical protein HF024_07560 [Leifsonia sp. PS1209]
MSPIQIDSETYDEIQREIDANKRWEFRLLPYAGIALVVLAAIVVVRTVFLT